ncbi:NAD(P)/FAD-dependent oxidoreductase [Roseivivax sediminis]|uniref:Sarcosine oxidase subunit beta n=1 Tax=Roseivivax sediminis TaxID=936889 RepID=A0A1I1T9Y7_9RHOB|nr:FAD-binding oxidoreductase [Roseivivax sediminis]SFD55444.1 sarcosine oxidase subunit beta [Roseivivax sediminis]
MNVIVLGGGLMGTATAYFLARRGIRVTLIDRRKVGSGATIASFGNIRRSGRHLPQLPLARRSLTLWHELQGLLGRDVEFRATGHLRLIFDTESLEDMRAFAEAARRYDLDLEELGPNQIRTRYPGLGPDAIAASFSPEDGSANPRLVSPAFAHAAARLGATVVDETAVASARHTGAGFSVETESGTFHSDALLNCTGAWGAGIAAAFGEPVPIEMRGPQMAVTEPLPHRVHPVVGMWSRDHGGYLRQVERGNVVFGGAAERTQADPETGHARPDPASLPVQLRSVLRLLPALRDVAVIRQWSGCEGYVADMLPVMGPSRTTPGLFHAFGFSGHGFQLGPGVGDAMAELIATGRCDTPLAPYAIDRFAA